MCDPCFPFGVTEPENPPNDKEILQMLMQQLSQQCGRKKMIDEFAEQWTGDVHYGKYSIDYTPGVDTNNKVKPSTNF